MRTEFFFFLVRGRAIRALLCDSKSRPSSAANADQVQVGVFVSPFIIQAILVIPSNMAHYPPLPNINIVFFWYIEYIYS